jgi:anhydro-N-acetylmuramic acid kinase
MLKAGAILSAGAFWWPGAPAITAASLLTDGETILEIGETVTRPLSQAESKRLAASGPEAAETFETVLAEALSRLPSEIAGIAGAEMMEQGGAIPDFNGAVLAEVLARPIASDFAAADLRLGGAGGPLGASLAQALARMAPEKGPLLLLEIDSAATCATYADPALKADKDGALLAFEAGPGLPSFTDTGTGGSADETALDLLLADPHFLRLAPKFAKPEAFAAYLDHLATLTPENAEATALAAIALSLVTGLDLLPKAPRRALVFGPACHEPRLLAALTEGLDCPVQTAEAAGLPGDALHALAAAHLAVRSARGLPTSFPGTTGVRTAVGGASISRPGEIA